MKTIDALFGSLIFTFHLSLSGIFFILTLLIFILFIALSWKVICEKSTNKY